MDSFVESTFEFLFKYRPLVFQSGQVAFDALVAPTALAASAAVLAVLVGWTYARTATGRPRDRTILAILRLAALGVALFCLARPILRVPVVMPQENWVGILLDDSRSMRVADVEGETRAAWVERSFSTAQSDLLARLSRRFRLRLFRFADNAERVVDAGELTFAGDRTRLGAALERARGELGSVPLSGLVMVTDGADNAATAPAAALLGLEAAGVPVFAVGVGRDALEPDIELERVAAPSTVLSGGSPMVDVVVRQAGYGGETVELVVEEGGRIVTTRQVELGADGESRVVRVPVPVEEPGPRRFRFRITPQPGERITENNTRETLVVVRDGRDKILYFEGVPRFELKFLRRAIRDDENLQLVTLVRTAEGRFLRLDVDSGEELADGFPTTREELFDYRGLVLGSVEASFFTHEQLRMIADFVDRRGGGLLVLGGRRSLAEGGWAGTPVADALPVVLDEDLRGDTVFLAELDIALTRAGAAHPALQLAEVDAESAERWQTLPPLTAVNRLSGLKPGATALLTGTGGALPEGQPVLADQRYGRGRAAVFAVQDSWLWQMHADIDVDDRTHERLWTQLLRWLVSDVPDRLEVGVPVRPVAPGEATEIRAELADSAYRGVNDARVVAHVTTPTGVVRDVPLEWTAERDGEYRGRFTPGAEGPYEVRVEATREGVTVASATTHLAAGDDDREFFGARMNAPLLRRMAEETGGRFYTPETVGTLPEDIAYTAKGITVIEEMELWNMPINFLLLAGLLLAEWAYRRGRGLV